MHTHVAKTLEDVQNVREFMEGDTWQHARRFLAAAPDNPFADHLRWVEEDGRPVSCVQVFLHQYPIGCAQLGMCLPEYPFVPPGLRGRGYFKRLMADLFGWMREAGYPLAYAHGRKGLYTGLGFAPCFHHCMVLIRVNDAAKVQAVTRCEAATDADVTDHEDIFRKPFPLGRGLQCRDEGWRPDPRCVRVVRGSGKGNICGFVVVGEILIGRTPRGRGFAAFKLPTTDDILTVTDSWATDVLTAATLLHSVGEKAEEMGFEWIRLNCRRDDPLARVAVLAGGELRWSAAQERDSTQEGEDVDAFYLTDLKLAIEQMLPELNARFRQSAAHAPSPMRLAMEGEEAVLGLNGEVRLLDCPPPQTQCVRLPRKAMTRAIMGYATPTELSVLHEGCEVPAVCRSTVDALFVAREPHLIHEGLAFAKPHQFGLVP